MKSPVRTAARLAVLSCLAYAASAHADWVVASDVEAIKPSPANFSVQPQNPPSFAWSRHSSNPPSYVVEVSRDGAVAYTFTSARNWYLPTQAFPAGHYTWRVRPSTSTTAWSDVRQFDVTATASTFLVPDNAALRTAVTQRVRPRQLPAGFVPASQWTAAMSAERSKPLTTLRSEIDYKITGMAPVSDALWPLTSSTGTAAALAAQASDIRTKINNMGRQLEGAALLYRLTLDPKYLNEALARGDQLASLSPTGPTSYANQDQGTRVICLSMIKAIDMLHNEIDATRRAKWLGVIDLRATDMYNDLSSNNMRLDQYPFDSHGGNNLGFLALIATLAVGDIPNANTWFDFATRAYINSIYAWSGPEGGYANGSAYGQYAADYAIQIWQPMNQALGVNLFTKPWSNGFMQFFAHFVPPGATRHVFGDENEVAPDFRLLKAYASRFDTPQAAWYAKNISGDEDTLSFLQAPYPLPYTRATSVVAPPNAALYPSIGWVAMHSDIADLKRTSVYFKSSPYGSYNHSHGDQNSLTVSSGGRPLLIEAGYMDYYGSPLQLDWYKTTKAHNAITFDGGVGEPVDGNTINLTRTGAVTGFSTTPSLDYAEGDATAAYAGALKSALRKVWYLRGQDVILVQDKVSSATARAFEWNLHTPAAMSFTAADNSVSSTNVDRSVCVRPLVNASGMSFQTRTGPAPKAGTYEAHAAYVLPSALAGEFVMMIDVGCNKPAVQMTETTTSRTFTIGAQTITMQK
ncbi:DUF4962 domain-containing protein [Massilia arenosa]|uniref:DUF4962 domain-containing protein n=1 Tax=Zemynaea arenosa TaxID=2561931 RepID=A0A4Y9SSC8_9BURK|nr:DUF4962 domain-containing protein [Massilia arenosa]TFW29348.1 DUF4962 domain-containing protein [Massilia arenosa]